MKVNSRSLTLAVAALTLGGLEIILLGTGCSSGPSSSNRDTAGPEWTRQPVRSVDQGYIVYVGTGEDQVIERASFKAEALAVWDLANECSFAPKGARVEDRFDHTLGSLHQSFVKVAVDFQTCEEAKKSLDPAIIRTLANVAMTEEIKHYQDLIDEPPPPPLSLPESQGATSGGASPTYGVVRDQPSFFILREQVAYVKQTVILAPPGAVMAPVSGAPVAQILAMPSRQVQAYEQANPGLRVHQPAWSQVQRQRGHPVHSAGNRQGSQWSRSTERQQRQSDSPSHRGGGRRKKRSHRPDNSER